MPIYEYRCDQCSHEFETIQKISEAALTECPACSKSALVKKVSAAAFRLKGGGWYETDFKSGGKRNLSGTEEGSSDSKETSKDSGSESKSEKPKSADSSSGSSDKPASKDAS